VETATTLGVRTNTWVEKQDRPQQHVEDITKQRWIGERGNNNNKWRR